jgi:hypothetical protein
MVQTQRLYASVHTVKNTSQCYRLLLSPCVATMFSRSFLITSYHKFTTHAAAFEFGSVNIHKDKPITHIQHAYKIEKKMLQDLMSSFTC